MASPSPLLLNCLLSIASGLLIGAGFFNSSLYLITWVAFVPLLWALKNATLAESYVYGFLCGLSCYLLGAYWVVDFIALVKNYSFSESFLLGVVFWIYSAQLLAVLAVLFRWLCLRSVFHPIVLFPIVTTFLYAYFPMLFSCQLGESQSRFILAIQATDLFGVSGLDAIIALSNYLVFSVISNHTQFLGGARNRVIATVSVVSILCWFSYGAWSLQHWQNLIAQWSTLQIGLVQPNEKPDTGRAKVFPGYSRAYPPEMDMTERLALSGADLVVWPEARYKQYFDEPAVAKHFQQYIANMKTPILFQDMEKRRTNLKGESELRNGAVFIDASGKQQQPYFKMKRVAFGEYIPLASDVPAIKAVTEQVFGEFTDEIQLGTGSVQYRTSTFNLLPLICYEVMFPEFVAQGVPEDARGFVLIALSSNGWFGKTIQPYQHVNSAALRAVENRLPLIHALNNGPSTIVLPDGRFLYEGAYHQAGGYLVSMPYSKQYGGSWYSSHPYLFLIVVAALLICAGVSSLPIFAFAGNAKRSKAEVELVKMDASLRQNNFD